MATKRMLEKVNLRWWSGRRRLERECDDAMQCDLVRLDRQVAGQVTGQSISGN